MLNRKLMGTTHNRSRVVIRNGQRYFAFIIPMPTHPDVKLFMGRVVEKNRGGSSRLKRSKDSSKKAPRLYMPVHASQLLATVFIIIFVFPSPRPLPCIYIHMTSHGLPSNHCWPPRHSSEGVFHIWQRHDSRRKNSDNNKYLQWDSILTWRHTASRAHIGQRCQSRRQVSLQWLSAAYGRQHVIRPVEQTSPIAGVLMVNPCSTALPRRPNICCPASWADAGNVATFRTSRARQASLAIWSFWSRLHERQLQVSEFMVAPPRQTNGRHRRIGCQHAYSVQIVLRVFIFTGRSKHFQAAMLRPFEDAETA